jgi:hypothetical protein
VAYKINPVSDGTFLCYISKVKFDIMSVSEFWVYIKRLLLNLIASHRDATHS